MGSIPITRSIQRLADSGARPFVPYGMKRLYQAHSTLEANLLKDSLAASHIEATIFGEYIGGAIGELPAMHFPEVWVEDEDMEPARRVLAAFLEPAPDAGQWRCAGCGETVDGQFELCWKCGAPRS